MVTKMGDKSIKKDTKKKKKACITTSIPASMTRPVMTQPQLIKK